MNNKPCQMLKLGQPKRPAWRCWDCRVVLHGPTSIVNRQGVDVPQAHCPKCGQMMEEFYPKLDKQMEKDADI